MNTWERFDRTTVLIVRGSVRSIQYDGPGFSTATIQVDKVILNESDESKINSKLEIKFSPSDSLRLNTEGDAYFFLGRHEGVWRLSDPDAGIWEINETRSGNENKRVLCFPSVYIGNLPKELFEKLDIPIPYDTARYCGPSRLKMYITRSKPVYYSSYYITETKLLKYFLDTKHNKSVQPTANASAE
jgi:hypothetical protein